MKKILSVIILFPILAYGWNANGHKVIAQIGYAHLNPHAKQMVDDLTKVLDEKYPPKARFMYASIWPDLLKIQDDVDAFSNWHFINYPYSVDGTKTKSYNTENVVWAINQSEKVLLSPKANKYEKAIFLRFLLHFVGDAHQPLHCITRYSKSQPYGDKGGNLFPIKNRAKKLHPYWDQGLGLLRRYDKKLALKIQQNYPESYFDTRANNLNPQDWSKESFNIGTDFVYTIDANTRPSSTYVATGQKIVAKQLALAAYRLANLLNYISNNQGGCYEKR